MKSILTFEFFVETVSIDSIPSRNDIGCSLLFLVIETLPLISVTSPILALVGLCNIN